MVQKIFSVYDSKAEAYLQPFFCSTTGLAVRNFETAVNSSDHIFAAHAGDYTLFEIGTFNDASGITEPLEVQVNLGLALHFITPEAPLTRPVGVISGGE